MNYCIRNISKKEQITRLPRQSTYLRSTAAMDKFDHNDPRSILLQIHRRNSNMNMSLNFFFELLVQFPLSCYFSKRRLDLRLRIRLSHWQYITNKQGANCRHLSNHGVGSRATSFAGTGRSFPGLPWYGYKRFKFEDTHL